eukprot:SAG11_NODE_1955_length_4005_cov_2.390937_6_plen_91_part_00
MPRPQIEEFMSRMRAEKKWRERAELRKSRKQGAADILVQEALAASSADERARIIDAAAKNEWNRSVLKQTMTLWGARSRTFLNTAGQRPL